MKLFPALHDLLRSTYLTSAKGLIYCSAFHYTEDTIGFGFKIPDDWEPGLGVQCYINGEPGPIHILPDVKDKMLVCSVDNKTRWM